MVEIEWSRDDRAFHLRSSILLEHSQEAVFAFFSDAFQLEKITPEWLYADGDVFHVRDSRR